ncbi:glycosyltransferase family 4 protein [Flavobacterium sp. J27]|uniref:glycosyltransferase family 4 protein n=1 Tax=Flavobacterium sp. J27 TaxID=2060419 RepID=UPI00102FA34B|nr:glycosyltransferase family 4 protein [Flavobacterium sp. J27]
MKNILFIHQSAELYGSDKTLLLLLSNLDKTKFNPVVIIPFDGPLKTELEKQEIKVIIAPVLKLYRNIFAFKNCIKFLQEIKKSVKIIDLLNKEYKFDLIYSNTLAVLLGAIYAKKRKIKHIWHVHEIIVHPKIIAVIFSKLLKTHSNLVICNSKATRENLINREPKLNKKIIVIYNGLEVPKVLEEKINKESFGFKNDDIIITLVGRISRLKGHKWLLNTYKNSFSISENIKLLFVGSPVEGQEIYLHEIEKFIYTNQLSNKVTILPFTTNLNPIWSITDIAIMPSTEAESFGLVALEAMLLKKPVIASNLGGLKEIVKDNVTGFLVESNNLKELEIAIEKLVENPQLRNVFGNKGFERAQTKFKLERYINQFEKTFEELI